MASPQTPSTTAPLISEEGKDENTATETEVPRSPTPSSEAAHPEMMEGATLSLLMGALFPCLPVAAVTAVLLSLIFYNRVEYPYSVTEQISEVHTSSLLNQTITEITNLKSGGHHV